MAGAAGAGEAVGSGAPVGPGCVLPAGSWLGALLVSADGSVEPVSPEPPGASVGSALDPDPAVG
jgi:hypothetical protein